MQRKSVFKKCLALFTVVCVMSMLMGVAAYADDTLTLAGEVDDGTVCTDGGTLYMTEPLQIAADGSTVGDYTLEPNNGGSGSSGTTTDVTPSYAFVVNKNILGRFEKAESSAYGRFNKSSDSYSIYEADFTPAVRWLAPYVVNAGGNTISTQGHTDKNVQLSVYCPELKGYYFKSAYIKSDGSIDYDAGVAAGDMLSPSTGSYSQIADDTEGESNHIFKAYEYKKSTPLYIGTPGQNNGNPSGETDVYTSESSPLNIIFTGQELDQAATAAADGAGAFAENSSDKAVSAGEIESLPNGFVTKDSTISVVVPNIEKYYYRGTLYMTFKCVDNT